MCQRPEWTLKGTDVGLLAVSAENRKALGQKSAKPLVLENPGSRLTLLLAVFSHLWVGLKQCPQLGICFGTFLSWLSADGQIVMSGGAVENTEAVLGRLLRELSMRFKSRRSVLCQQSADTLEL